MSKRLIAMLVAVFMIFSMITVATAEEETITLHIALECSSTSFKEGESESDNWWTRQYKERYNVEVIVDWSADSSNYDTKLNLAMVAGELPDAFRVNSLTQLEQLVAAGQIMELTDIFENNASDLVKKLYAQDSATAETGIVDGGLYGIANLHWGWSSNPYYVWLRQDWMDEQNLSAPETMDDLVNIMKTFKEVYGGWGMAVDKSLAQFYNMANAWGAYPTLWVETEDGTMEPGAIQPEMKEALGVFAQWYEEGLIDPNFTTYDMDAMYTDVVNGKIGVQVFQQWWGYTPGSDIVKEQGADAYFTAYEMPSATTEVLYPINFTNAGYTVINKNCEHPEAVIQLMDLYAQVWYGDDPDEEMVAYTLDVEKTDSNAACGPFRIVNTRVEDENFERVNAAIVNNDESYLTSSTAKEKYTGAMKWIQEQDASGLGDYMQHGAGEHAAFGLGSKIVSEGRTKLDALWGKQPEIMNMYGDTLDDILLEGFTRIITGEEELDYFDTLVESYRAAGGDDVIAAVNELYE